MNETAVHELARAWLASARGTLRVAHSAVADESYPDACFTAQQVVEKALKAFLLWQGEAIIFTHNLLLLLGRCKKYDQTFAELTTSCETLNPYYIDTRYPESVAWIEEYTMGMAEEAAQIADLIFAFVEARIK